MSLKRRIGHRILALALSLTLVLSLPLFMPTDSYAATKFKDTRGHWAEGFITRASSKEFVNGYPDGRFLPDKSVTRAEFVSMVNNAFNINIDYDATSYTDVTYEKWYYKAVSMAETTSYTAGGSGEKTFRPNSPITRQEAAVMLSNILPNYKGGGNLKTYRDYRLIATWATAAFEKMTGREYFGAYSDGKIHPTDPLTRAQAAKILCDILDNETIVTRKTTIDENDTKLTEKIYTDDVTIDEDLGEGNATIDNCVILGKLTIEGGGSKSITINNSRIASVVMDKEDSAVRLVTKGSTVIPKLSASEKSILQTAGKDGYGILNVTVNKGADVTMKGNFPIVNIMGSTATVALESGKIAALTVTGAGKYSDITLTGKAQVAEATVNAESYFHGEGVVTQMYVNVDNVTYETKPKKMIVGTTIDRAEEEGNSDVDVTFKPKSKATDVEVDTKITLTFTSSMKLADGKAISTTNIKDFVSLKVNKRDGDDEEFTAEINSAKKIITLTPTSDLSTSTRYYVILKDEALINTGGTNNDGASAYFTTSSKGGSTSATFSPSNGATGVSTSAAITIKFAEDVVKFSDGSEVTSAYLQECVQLKNGSASGANVTFTAAISSSDTITITPSTSLTAGQAYYVAVVADKLKTKGGGRTISASSAIWSVAAATVVVPPPVIPTTAAAILTTITVSPTGGSNVLTGFSGTTTLYNVVVPYGTTSVDVTATAASGTTIQIDNVTGGAATMIPVGSNVTTAIPVTASASGMTTTTYYLNIEVAGNTSLSHIQINYYAFPPTWDSYTYQVAPTDTSIELTVMTDDWFATITLGNTTEQGWFSQSVNLVPGDQDITFIVKSNKTTKTYTIHVIRL